MCQELWRTCSNELQPQDLRSRESGRWECLRTVSWRSRARVKVKYFSTSQLWNGVINKADRVRKAATNYIVPLPWYRSVEWVLGAVVTQCTCWSETRVDKTKTMIEIQGACFKGNSSWSIREFRMHVILLSINQLARDQIDSCRVNSYGKVVRDLSCYREALSMEIHTTMPHFPHQASHQC